MPTYIVGDTDLIFEGNLTPAGEPVELPADVAVGCLQRGEVVKPKGQKADKKAKPEKDEPDPDPPSDEDPPEPEPEPESESEPPPELPPIDPKAKRDALILQAEAEGVDLGEEAGTKAQIIAAIEKHRA